MPVLANVLPSQVGYSYGTEPFTALVAAALGNAGTTDDGFDAMLNDAMAALAEDDAAGGLDDSDLAAASFVAGEFEGSVLSPVAQDVGDLQTNGEVSVGQVATPPTSGSPDTSPTLFQRFSTTTLPFGAKGTGYTFPMLYIGGQPPYTYKLAAVQPAEAADFHSGLPPGFTLSSDGTFSGTPTQGGRWLFAVTVTDQAGSTDTATWEFGTPAF